MCLPALFDAILNLGEAQDHPMSDLTRSGRSCHPSKPDTDGPSLFRMYDPMVVDDPEEYWIVSEPLQTTSQAPSNPLQAVWHGGHTAGCSAHVAHASLTVQSGPDVTMASADIPAVDFNLRAKNTRMAPVAPVTPTSELTLLI